jgi:hypothetical protein
VKTTTPKKSIERLEEDKEEALKENNTQLVKILDKMITRIKSLEKPEKKPHKKRKDFKETNDD